MFQAVYATRRKAGAVFFNHACTSSCVSNSAISILSMVGSFSPAFRSSEAELELCDQLGLAFLPWSPLGGITAAARLGSAHTAFEQVAAERDVTPQRICLAWLLAKSPHVIPIPGSSRPETIQDSARAVDVDLTRDEFDRLDVLPDHTASQD